MAVWMAVALGGALGALGRFGVARWAQDAGWTDWPWATLTVNLLGAALLAFAGAVLPGKVPPALQAGLTTGALGAFTTYSTFNQEVLQMVGDGRRGQAAGYLVATLVGALLTGSLGFYMGRTLA